MTIDSARSTDTPESFAKWLAGSCLNDVRKYVPGAQLETEENTRAWIEEHLLRHSKHIRSEPRRREWMMILARRLRRGSTDTR